MTDGTYVTIVAPTNDTQNPDNDKEITISGTCSNGQIAVSVDKTTYVDGEVDLSLAGLNLSNSNNSPIYVAAIDGSCNISVKNNTENTLSDGESYTNADEDNGVIYSKDDLKIKGKGTLNITGNCGYGIISKNDLKVYNGNLQITSKDVCLKGKDSVKIGDKDDFGTEGAYENLKLTLNSTASDCVRSNNPTNNFVSMPGNGGRPGNSQPTPTPTPTNGTTSTDISAKGFKSEGDMIINGGTATFDTSDDSFHCGGNLTFNGGNFTIATGNITISGGTTIVECPTNGGNSGVDNVGTFTFEGGILIALDGGGMMGDGIPSDTTHYLTATISNSAQGTNTIAIADATGKVASIFQYSKAATRITYMNGDITASEYTATLNPTYDGTLDDFGYGTGGTISGGTALASGGNSFGGFPSWGW